MSKYFQVYDCELTHSNRDGGDILSLACVIGNCETLELVDSYVGYARPRFPNKFWNPHAEKTHRISKARAMTFPVQRQLALGLLHFLKPYKNEDDSPMPFITHSSDRVDYDFIKRLYEREDLISSFSKVAKDHFVIRSPTIFQEYLRSKQMPTNKTNLKLLASEFGCALKHHEVMSDTQACFVGVREMIKHFKKLNRTFSSHSQDLKVFNMLLESYKLDM